MKPFPYWSEDPGELLSLARYRTSQSFRCGRGQTYPDQHQDTVNKKKYTITKKIY